MSKTEAKKIEPKQKSSAFFPLMAGLIVLGVVVAGVALNILSYQGEDPEEPDRPDEPVPTTVINGQYFFDVESNTYEWAFDDYAVINHWDDIEHYFGNDQTMIEAAKKHIKKTGYSLESSDTDERYILVRVDVDGGKDLIRSVGLEIPKNSDPKIAIRGYNGCGQMWDEYDYEYWLIPIDSSIDEEEFEIDYTIDEGCGANYSEVEKKPVIYLYPEAETNVSVKLGAKEKLTVSYPKYIDGWNVLARPDGKLTDLNTGRELYSLYYETEYNAAKGIQDEGFVVKGSDTAAFLEDKLAKLGLNEREAEEFIIFWLPQMQDNNYNYIHFADLAEIDANMPLNVSPAPATTIRINMKGFTLVEWGGTILK